MEVVTLNRSRDIRFSRDWTSKSRHLEEVATSTLNQKMSRRHLAVATSVVRKKVTTSFSGRDISCKERRSRRHLAVAKSIARKEGRDVI